MPRQRGWQVGAADVLEMPTVLIGDASRIADDLSRHREQLGISYFVLRHSQLDDAAPIVRRLAGT